MDIVVLINVMIKIVAVMVVGYFLGRIKKLTAEINKNLSWIVVNVTAPLLIIYSMFQVKVEDPGIVWVAMFWGCISYAVFMFIAMVGTKLLRIPRGKQGVYRFLMVFSNCGFMGYPVLQSLYGTAAIFYAAIFCIPFNLLAYTWGAFVLQADSRESQADSGENVIPPGKTAFDLKKLINAGTVSSILAVALFLAHLRLPETAIDFCGLVGNMTTPLSMMILGANMADISLKDTVKDKDVWVISFLRLLVLPVLLYFLLTPMKIDNYLLRVAVVCWAMPGASTCVMLSQASGGNVELSSKSVVLSTLLSVISLPVMAAVLHLI